MESPEDFMSQFSRNINFRLSTTFSLNFDPFHGWFNEAQGIHGVVGFQNPGSGQIMIT